MTLVYWQNDRNPSISDQLTSGGTPVDLSSATVTFKMRGPLDGAANATVKVNQPVSSKDASGNWRYDWGVTDLDTVGTFLVWLEVTVSGKVQTLWESPIEVRAHSALGLYVELEQLKETLTLQGETFADRDLQAALRAACRGLDQVCNRRFYKDTVDATRYYTPTSRNFTVIDDLADFTSLAVDLDGDGIFEQSWTENTHFIFEPTNAETDGVPRELIRVHPRSGRYFVSSYPRSVQVVGKFGWDAVPAEIVEATTILASKLVRRAREAPFGVLLAPSIDGGGAIARIAKNDPDVSFLIDAYIRVPVAA